MVKVRIREKQSLFGGQKRSAYPGKMLFYLWRCARSEPMRMRNLIVFIEPYLLWDIRQGLICCAVNLKSNRRLATFWENVVVVNSNDNMEVEEKDIFVHFLCDGSMSRGPWEDLLGTLRIRVVERLELVQIGMKFASRIIKTTLLFGMCSNIKFVHHPSKVLKELLRGRISFLRQVAKKGNELARTVVTEGI